MAYILLMVVHLNGQLVSFSPQFDTLAACNEAGRLMREQMQDAQGTVFFVCAPKAPMP
jgi:hypothetical protein